MTPKQIALLKNPTIESAMEFWPAHLLGPPLSHNTALAGIHKARLAWKGSSKAMIKESKAWLAANGYGATPPGRPDPNVPQAAKMIRQ